MPVWYSTTKNKTLMDKTLSVTVKRLFERTCVCARVRCLEIHVETRPPGFGSYIYSLNMRINHMKHINMLALAKRVDGFIRFTCRLIYFCNNIKDIFCTLLLLSYFSATAIILCKSFHPQGAKISSFPISRQI